MLLKSLTTTIRTLLGGSLCSAVVRMMARMLGGSIGI